MLVGGVAVGSVVTSVVAASSSSFSAIAVGTGVAIIWNVAVPPIVTTESQCLGEPDPYQRESGYDHWNRGMEGNYA